MLFRIYFLSLVLSISTIRSSCFLLTRHSSRHSQTAVGCSSISEDKGSISSLIVKNDLLRIIPNCLLGAPATNVTTEEDQVKQILSLASALELLSPFPPIASSPQSLEALGGDWQLIYSDASEITKIAKLPLGFRLGPVFQVIDTSDGRFENQALIKHRFKLLSGSTRVIANFWLSPLGEVNRVGVVNIGERANVKFRKIIFSLRRFLFFPTFGKISKTAIPNGAAEQANVIPCIDVTYLDNTMRISRGGDGSMFILVRANGKDGRKKAMPIFSLEKTKQFSVDQAAPTYDPSVDILPSGIRG